MALAASSFALLAAGLFAVIATLLGHRVLRLLALDICSPAEHLLTSAALGVICTEVLLFFAQFLQHIRLAVLAVIALSLLLGATEFSAAAAKFSAIIRTCAKNSHKSEKFLITVTALVLLLEGFAAMAPVTGSDALHYHFAAPRLILQSGFHPDFFLSHSFFLGQSHLLILAGLALGSSQLAMAFLFLGGVLAAVAGACLARRWVGRTWAWTTALLFLLTPVVFWQISAAGAPDLWMAFFATTGVLAISSAAKLPNRAHSVLAGVLAGAVAGTKYTGCFIAASLAVAFLWEVRSIFRLSFFFLGSIAAGVYPYARNFVWTGDPMFPFLLPWLSPSKINAYALLSYRADTGAAESRHLWQVLKFPLFAAIDRAHLGFWQFLGPLVLAFAPLLLLAIRNTPTWRAAFAVWVLSSFAIGAASGMTRFLLPVLPIAIAAALAGLALLEPDEWRLTRYVSLASLFSFLLLGAAGLLIYNRSALSAGVGLTPADEYLRHNAPEYESAQFVNQVLAGKGTEGNALVFLRHLYYLRIPYLYGDPAASWAVDPSKFQTKEEWKALFKKENIRWVVRSQDYPPAIAAPLQQLENTDDLLPVAQSKVSDFQGLRISGERQTLPLVIFEVQH